MPFKTLTDKLESVPAGHVWLVGAGPGDPGLFTLAALKAIQTADSIVYDALINSEILEFANASAEKIYSGKRGGKPSATQDDISFKLVELARKGKRVVRLKGGDPFIFGRGGEEALTLFKHNIPFKIIPGISSGIAGPSYAGIPLTHRDNNSIVSFVTGHNANNEELDKVDWKALANSGGTLVLFMTLHRLALIATKLITAGRPGKEPVALISNATLENQRVIQSTLDECKNYSKDWNIATPCIIVVGNNVALRSKLKWFNT